MKLFRFFQALRNFMISMYSTGRNPYEAIYNIQVTLDCGSEGKLRKVWEDIEFDIREEEEVLGHKVRILKTDEDFERYL